MEGGPAVWKFCSRYSVPSAQELAEERANQPYGNRKGKLQLLIPITCFVVSC